MLELLDLEGGEVTDHSGIFESRALERYPYEWATLSMDTRLQFFDGEGNRSVEARPDIHSWRVRLHLDVIGRMEEGEKKQRLLRHPPVDNKETFRIEWRGELWYVQFWDGWVCMSKQARVRREW